MTKYKWFRFTNNLNKTASEKTKEKLE